MEAMETLAAFAAKLEARCSFLGCAKKLRAGGLCAMHYARKKRHGDPSVALVHHGPVAQRFWQKVRKGYGCWEWTASKDEHGYGRIHENGRPIHAQRVAWRLAHGDPGKLHVLHRCDNPGCVRPDHLFLGTPLDNARDQDAKGRRPRGEKRPQAKLTSAKVGWIRGEARSGVSHSSLAMALGVSRQLVSDVVAGKRWRHV